MSARSLVSALVVSVLFLVNPTAATAGEQEAQNQRMTPVVRVVQAVGPAVVNVYQDIEREVSNGWYVYPMTTRSLGSGFIIDSDGYILTNAHVIQGGDNGIHVDLFDGTSLPARLVRVDTDNDVALLQIDPPEGHTLVEAPIGTSSDLMVGESVIAIGNPLGNENSVSTGIVSSMYRDVRVRSAESRDHASPSFKDFIQIDAPINPGNSGGPLLNAVGQVIGINFAIDQNAQGIGFAIPIDRVRKSLIGHLLNPRLDREVVTGLEIAGDSAGRDVHLTEVTPGGPAAAAGLKPGDRLLEVAHHPIQWEFDYNKALLDTKPGESVPVVVQRDGRTITANVELERDESPMLHITRALGLRVVDHPQFRGVSVQQVDPAGPGALLGIQRGDLVDGIDDTLIDSSMDLYDAVRDMSAGHRITVHLWRGRTPFSGPLTLR